MAKSQAPLCQCGHSLGWHVVGCRRCPCPKFQVPDLMAALEASLTGALTPPRTDAPNTNTEETR